MTIRIIPASKRVGAFVRIRGERHVISSSEADGRKTFLHVETGHQFTMSRSQQKELEDNGDLTSDEAMEMLDAAVQEALDTDWDSFTHAERESAYRKKAYMDGMDAIPARFRRSASYLQEMAIEVRNAIEPELAEPPSVRSLKRWHFRWVTSGKDIRALADMNWKKGNRNENDPHAWMDEILHAHIKHFMMKPPYATAAWTARQADKEIRLESKRSGRPLRDNVNTEKRHIGAHRIYDLLERYGYYDRLVNQLGRKDARTKSRSKTTGPQGDFALQQVEVDHTQVDLMIYDSRGRPRRPWLTVLIDRFSRLITGFYLTFEAPSWVSVMMAMRMGVMPKVGYLNSLDYKFTFDWDCYGTPDHLYMDRGPEFMSESLRATAQQLKMRLVDLPRASGYLKGKVERWFLGANQGLFHALPGYTGRNPTKRVEESVKPKLRMKELEVIVAAYIVDVYNHSTHGTTGEWPAKRYKESMASGVHHKWPPKAGLLGPATSHARAATLRESGIKFDNIQYQSDELYALWLRRGGNCKVIVRQDLGDGGRILVFDGSHRPWVEGFLMGKYAGQKITFKELKAAVKADRAPSETDEERNKQAEAQVNLKHLIDQKRPGGQFKPGRPPSNAAVHTQRQAIDPEKSKGAMQPFDPGDDIEVDTHGLVGPFAAPSAISEMLDELGATVDAAVTEHDLRHWKDDHDGQDNSDDVDITYVSVGSDEGPELFEERARGKAKKPKAGSANKATQTTTHGDADTTRRSRRKKPNTPVDAPDERNASPGALSTSHIEDGPADPSYSTFAPPEEELPLHTSLHIEDVSRPPPNNFGPSASNARRRR